MLKYILRDMASVLRFLPYGLVAGIIVAIILSAVNDRRVRRDREPFSVAAVTGFFMYVVILLFITFLSRENGSRVGGVDLELFSTWGINTRNNAYVIENVLLFIPYGFLCAWVFRGARRLLPCTLIGLLTSLGIECMQLVTKRGFFQIDDVITNTLGALIGYILYRCVMNEEKTGREKSKWGYRILAIVLILGAMLCVFAFSSDSAAQSNELSMKVTRLLVDRADRWLNVNLDGEQTAAVLTFLHPLIRKLAHASEYAALAIAIGFGCQMIKKKRARVVNYFYAVFLCGLISVVDEMLQKYVFLRTGRLTDVAIDIIGAIVGGCFYVFLSELLEFLMKEE